MKWYQFFEEVVLQDLEVCDVELDVFHVFGYQVESTWVWGGCLGYAQPGFGGCPGEDSRVVVGVPDLWGMDIGEDDVADLGEVGGVVHHCLLLGVETGQDNDVADLGSVAGHGLDGVGTSGTADHRVLAVS